MEKGKNNLNVDFIGMGAVKCGTSWIWRCLREHPQICMPKTKELRFFNSDEKYEKGVNYYKIFFNDCPQNFVKGEFTPDYINHPDTAKRIKKCFPNVKLIASLRNPIERAYTHYWYERSRGFELNAKFENVIKENPQYREGGFYYKNLKSFSKLFPREKMLILIYEDIAKDPIKFIQRIYHFLGVDENFIPPSINKKILATPEKQSSFIWINRITMKFIKISKKNILLKRLVPWAEFFGFKKVIALFYRLGEMGRKIEGTKLFLKPPIKEEARKFLQEIYREDIKNLEKLINKDLSSWK